MFQTDENFTKRNHCKKCHDPTFVTFTKPTASYKHHGNYILQGYGAVSHTKYDATL
jgi:hypothetical protein